MAYTAIYDACVLFPAPLRDLLLQLATTGLFRARWTERIQQEWIRALLERRKDLTPEQLDRTRAMMEAAVPDCLITGYEPLEAAVELPDPDDRHVLAAAIRGQAAVIVTSNLKDFPPEHLARWDIEAQHPDEFIRHAFDLHPGTVVASVRACRLRLNHPPMTAADLLDVYLQLGLTSTVAALQEMVETI